MKEVLEAFTSSLLVTSLQLLTTIPLYDFSRNMAPSMGSNWLENRIRLVVTLGLIPNRNDHKRRTFLWRNSRYLSLYQSVMVMLDQLDQPISLLETSPLLNLKYVLDCGSGNHAEGVLPPGIHL